MKIHEKIKYLREFNHWTQEEMAERVHMSPSGYAKIERGETKLHLDKIQQIAQVFEINIFDLLTSENGGDTFYNHVHTNSSNSIYNRCQDNDESKNEIANLKEIIACKDVIIAEKDKQIALLNALLENKEK